MTTPTSHHADRRRLRDRHRLRRTAAATAALLALAVGACSSSGGSVTERARGTSTTTAPTPPTSTAPPSTEAPSPDPDPEPTSTPVDHPTPVDLDEVQARLDAINLTLEDLPEGWTAEPDVQRSGTVVADCATHGGPDHVPARSSSDRFSLSVDEGGLGLDTSSGYVIDVATAERLLAEIGSDGFASCVTDQLLADAEDVTVEGAFDVVDGLPELGDDAVALQGDFHLSDSTGQAATMSMIVVSIRTDQVISSVSAIAYDTPGDEQLLYQVLDLVAARQSA